MVAGKRVKKEPSGGVPAVAFVCPPGRDVNSKIASGHDIYLVTKVWNKANGVGN
jgi:hypothetical protein